MRKKNMAWRNTPHRYGIVAQSLHWLIAALVVLQFYLGLSASDLPMSMERLILLGRHKSVGMTIFMLTVLRLGWRLYSPPPPLPGHMAPWERRLARGTHYLLYGILLSMPVAGWISSSAFNLSVSWFGLFTWPDLVEPDKALAGMTKTIHASLAGLLLLTLLLHVAGALRHHFWLRDDVLRRMLPGQARRAGRSKP